MNMFQVGDDVFVRDPQRFIPACTCIVGPIAEVRSQDGTPVYLLRADVGITGGGGYLIEREFSASDLGHRVGTPLSQLSGRPGTAGFEQFCRIAESWGYL